MSASVAAHAILTRALPQRNTVILFLAGGLGVGVMLLGWAGWAFGMLSLPFVAAAVTYAAFCELYVFLFTLALSSVSANILVRLAARPVTPVSLDASYNSVDMVQQRLSRMQSAGLIAWNADAFRLTSRGATVVRAYHLLRSLFRHT